MFWTTYMVYVAWQKEGVNAGVCLISKGVTDIQVKRVEAVVM